MIKLIFVSAAFILLCINSIGLCFGLFIILEHENYNRWCNYEPENRAEVIVLLIARPVIATSCYLGKPIGE